MTMNAKQLTSVHYLKAALVAVLLTGMTIADWHVYECMDEPDCTICTVQKSTSGFLIASPDTAIAAQYPTAENSDPVIEVLADDALIFATASRAPPANLR